MKQRAQCLVRESVGGLLIARGLVEAGLELRAEIREPGPEDVLVIWNRIGLNANLADVWENKGATVVVAENGYLGRHWNGQVWTALAIGHHAGAGVWPRGGAERWDGWGVPLAAWRYMGERLILGQRGLGEPGVAAPRNWAQEARARYGGRIRPHPREVGATGLQPLLHELSWAGEVLTWNSGAALTALAMGVPVHYAFPQWIGGAAGRLLGERDVGEPQRDDAARLAMFRNLAWAQWTDSEISDGTAFRHLLQ